MLQSGQYVQDGVEVKGHVQVDLTFRKQATWGEVTPRCRKWRHRKRFVHYLPPFRNLLLLIVELCIREWRC